MKNSRRGTEAGRRLLGPMWRLASWVAWEEDRLVSSLGEESQSWS